MTSLTTEIHPSVYHNSDLGLAMRTLDYLNNRRTVNADRYSVVRINEGMGLHGDEATLGRVHVALMYLADNGYIERVNVQPGREYDTVTTYRGK